MKLAITTATCVVALSALGISPQARANSYELHQGSECKVFGSTAWTDLAFSGYGVKNLQSSARQVICPLTKKAQSSWDGTGANGANVRAYIETGTVAASATCTAYVTSDNAAAIAVNTYSRAFGTMAAHSSADFFLSGGTEMSSVTGSNWFEDKIYMLCTLGPQVRLKGYYIYEWAGVY